MGFRLIYRKAWRGQWFDSRRGDSQDDGTEGVQLIWLGRRSIPGIEPGRTLNVRGRVAMRDGQKVIYNPDYDLLPVHA